jgi:hypothetical protein
MFHFTASIVLALVAFCLIAVLLLFFVGESQARISDRLVDRDWAARQNRTDRSRGGSA